MPVIGRLDKQVNDVLIGPVGKRPRRDEGDDARTPIDTRRDAADEHKRGIARNADDEKSRPRAEHGEERGRGDEQLPVWLL